jgi:hypothetical protein
VLSHYEIQTVYFGVLSGETGGENADLHFTIFYHLEIQSGKWFATPLIILFVGNVVKLRLQVRYFIKSP